MKEDYKVSDTEKLYIRINLFIIRCAWHALYGARPRNFNLYKEIGINRGVFSTHISPANFTTPFNDDVCYNFRVGTQLPEGCLKGTELIECGIKHNTWEEYFAAVDAFNENPQSGDLEEDRNTKGKNIEETIKNHIKDKPEQYSKEFEALCHWLSGKTSYKKVGATRFIGDMAAILDERLTVEFIRSCDKEVLNASIKTISSKLTLMKAVQTCMGAEEAEKQKK